MSDTVIRIENLSKQYRLGLVSTGTVSHDLNRWWCKMVGKEDPYLKIGESNDRTSKGESDYVWALKDINLEVKRGERIGIIGKNGAGKSTLLKILSQVTGPTTGSVKMKGRVGALLEVGTGFHRELTGRENIYMNGTILGMKRWEVKNKLDEIVDFAGVERYLDTPVKRYSSGMMVRLGFAVAAHLEPDILIVDEVLAVGDAEFQKKAIGKMKEVSEGQGRTILFVSHNLTAIDSLCERAMLIEKGSIILNGSTSKVIDKYHSDSLKRNDGLVEIPVESNKNSPFYPISISIESCNKVTSRPKISEDIKIIVKFKAKNNKKVWIGIHLLNKRGIIVFTSSNRYPCSYVANKNIGDTFNIWCAELTIPRLLLNPGPHSINLNVHDWKGDGQYSKSFLEIISFDIKDDSDIRKEYAREIIGVVRPQLSWNTYNI